MTLKVKYPFGIPLVKDSKRIFIPDKRDLPRITKCPKPSSMAYLINDGSFFTSLRHTVRKKSEKLHYFWVFFKKTNFFLNPWKFNNFFPFFNGFFEITYKFSILCQLWQDWTSFFDIVILISPSLFSVKVHWQKV